jgi:hypothetical protein
VYTFVAGPGEALTRATAAAGDKDVDIFQPASAGSCYRPAASMSSASTWSPVLLGAGTRLFDSLRGEHIQLKALDVIEGPKATHLRSP